MSTGLRELTTFQGAHCDTFCHPPVDGSLTVPELYEYHATKSPQHPLFVYADEQKELKTIRYPEAFRAIRRAAGLASNHYKFTAEQSQNASHPPVCGILAVADTLSYLALIVGLMYIGLSPFPISTRNSAAGVAHLLKATSVQKLFVSTDPAMQRLSKEAIDILAKEGYSIDTIPMPQFGDLYTEGEPEPVVQRTVGLDATAIIMHSSGSTAFPKPIRMSNRNFIQWGILPYHGDVDICNVAIAVHSLPVFHAMSAINLVWATCAGSIMACFKPSSNPAPPTPDMFLEAIVATDSKVVFCVPAFIEAWARFPDNIAILQTSKAIIYSGAPMNVAVGDRLSSAGVNLVPFYGSTEMGCFSTFIPKSKQHSEWQYFGISKHLSVEMVPQDNFDNVFEPVVLASPSFSPNAINTTIKGQPGYASSDLLLRHPTNPDLYKVFGRADDQIMLSTGEKTNPVPLETMFVQDPHIAAAIMFGRGRFQNGILIQPKEPFEPGDTAKLTTLRNAIWPTVEKVNNYAPTHSRIFKEMIIFTSPAKPFEYTPKGTPQRHACLVAYEEEIEALYAAIKESSQPDLIPPIQWTTDSTLRFIRDVVENVVLAPLTDDTDLFRAGCDSLQATWIRNTILRSLRATSGLRIHKVPFSFVYNHPTIRTLSAYVFGLVIQDADKAREKESNVPDPLSVSAAPQPRHSSTSYASDNIVSGATLEKLVDNGGLPLILIHGGSGNFLAFLPMMQNMKSSLWALQITEEVPLHSVDAIAKCYFDNIKTALAHGPYRLGAYCVTSVILFALAKLFEANDDTIAELSVIEHFPLLFARTLFEPDEESIKQRSPTAALEDRIIRELAVPLFDIASPSHLHVATALIAALDGERTEDPFILTMLRNLRRLFSMTCEFMFKLLPPDQAYSSSAARRAMIDWLATVRAPVTTFVASEGIVELFPEWDDLGTGQAFPGARVVKVPASNHFSIFESDVFADSIQHWGGRGGSGRSGEVILIINSIEIDSHIIIYDYRRRTKPTKSVP